MLSSSVRPIGSQLFSLSCISDFDTPAGAIALTFEISFCFLESMITMPLKTLAPRAFWLYTTPQDQIFRLYNLLPSFENCSHCGQKWPNRGRHDPASFSCLFSSSRRALKIGPDLPRKPLAGPRDSTETRKRHTAAHRPSGGGITALLFQAILYLLPWSRSSQ